MRRSRSPVLAWQTARASSAKLLMLENMVLARAQPDVHLASIEPTWPKWLAGTDSLYSIFKPLADFIVIQQMWLVLQHDPIQNLDHGVDIFLGIEAECFDAAFVVARRTATFLGRALTPAPMQAGQGLRGSSSSKASIRTSCFQSSVMSYS